MIWTVARQFTFWKGRVYVVPAGVLFVCVVNDVIAERQRGG